MLQYTNGFTCAVDNDKQSLIINFVQTVPIIDINGNVERNETEQIASIVMSYASAVNLSQVLENVLNPEGNK